MGSGQSGTFSMISSVRHFMNFVHVAAHKPSCWARREPSDADFESALEVSGILIRSVVLDLSYSPQLRI